MALNFLLSSIVSVVLLNQLTLTAAMCPEPISDLCNCTRWIEGLQLVCSGANFPDVISTLQAGKDQIQILEYKDGNLTELTEDMFANISIKEINLSGNNISTVDDKAFSSLASVLQRLTLANNSLTSIPNLSGLEELQSLNLAGNMINTVEVDVFPGNPKLTQLVLKDNKICSLPLDALKETKETLELLSLAGNCLKSVPKAVLMGSQRLTYLDLSDNEIPSLPNMAFKDLPRLKELRLSGNKISTIGPMAFKQVPNLQILNLKNNQIRVVEPKRVLPYASLRLLDLSGNSIETIPSLSFKNISSLQQLFLDDNMIQTVESFAFTQCPELQVISLQNNKLTNLNKNTFNSLDKMSTLLLANNSLTSISREGLVGMPNLEQLSFRNNNISSMEANAFALVPKLTILDLGKNNLSIVPSNVFGDLSELFTLDLCCNGIKTLTERTFTEGKLKNIMLHDNMLVCDEGLDWFISFVLNRNIRLFVPPQPEVVCAGPSDYEGVQLKDVLTKRANSTFHKALKDINPIGVAQDGNLLENILPALKDFPGLTGGAALAQTLPSLTDIFASAPGIAGFKSITDPIFKGITTAGSLGTLRGAVEDFTEPLTSMIKGGTPESRKFNNLFGSIPELISNIPGEGGNAAPGFPALKISDIPPEVLQHIMSGGTLPGVPKTFMESLVAGYMRNMALAAANALEGKDTINGVKTSTYLPPLDSFPPELIQQFIHGKTLPGLTEMESNTIKKYYISQAVKNTNTTTSAGTDTNSVAPTKTTDGSTTGTQAPKRRLVSAAEILKQLPRDFDFSKIPRSILRDFAAGKELDVSAIPKSVIDQIRKTNPELVARLEEAMRAEVPADQVEQKNKVDPTDLDFVSLLPATHRPPPPIETFRLDRPSEEAVPAAQSGERIALYAVTGVSLFALVTAALIAYLCVRKQKLANDQSSDGINSTKFLNSSIRGSMLGGNSAMGGTSAGSFGSVRNASLVLPSNGSSPNLRQSPSWVYSASGLPDYQKTEAQTAPS